MCLPVDLCVLSWPWRLDILVILKSSRSHSLRLPYVYVVEKESGGKTSWNILDGGRKHILTVDLWWFMPGLWQKKKLSSWKKYGILLDSPEITDSTWLLVAFWRARPVLSTAVQVVEPELWQDGLGAPHGSIWVNLLYYIYIYYRYKYMGYIILYI